MTYESGRKELDVDDAIAAVRDDVPAPEVAGEAAARVWERLCPAAIAAAPSTEAIGGCADVRLLLDAHRRGELPAARALLVEDHLRDCVACRAAFLRPGRRNLALLAWPPSTSTAGAAAPRPWRAHAVAASVLLAASVSAWVVRQAFFGVPAGPRAAVQSVAGGLLRVAAGDVVPLLPGQEIGEGEPVRTGRDSRAVLRLRDGSLVEMSERAELSLLARGADTTIQLSRGRIIVQAAKRRTGHLRVASGDCTVSVTGTVFSVNHGLKGSRVSVFEGHVQVAGGADERTLAPGDQWATSAAMETVPLRDEIAWSADADRHLALLAEMKVLRERFRSVPDPGLRYESRLLALVPAEAVVFASVPNYGEGLGEAYRLFEERLRESAVLRDWWTQADPARHGGPALASVIERIRSFSSFLGEEIVLAAVDVGGRPPVRPLVVAEVRRPGLREFLEGELARVPRPQGQPSHVHILGESDGAAPASAEGDVFILLRPGLMAVSMDGPTLQGVAARLDGGAPDGLAATPFGARIAQAYGDGVGLLAAADLQRISARAAAGRPDARHAQALRQAGIDGLRYLVFERKQVAEEARTTAVLAFDGAPRGIASWLAAPAPMGALDFVTPSAQGAAAFVAKSPASILDDLVAMAAAAGGHPREELLSLESKLDLRIREDLAETLGGEFALALDGPLFPTPAWKLIAEVNDPARLQASIQTLVRRAGEEAARAGGAAWTLESEDVGGQTFHAIRGGLPFEVHYAYADGYVVAAPSRALVMRALQARASGETLARSDSFRALFLPDRDVNVSGLLYQNVGPTVRSLLEAPGAGALTGDQRRSMEALTRDARPTVLCAYGEPSAVRVAGLGGVFDLDTSDLALPMLLERLWPGTPRAAAP
jgi:hypothetical protein